MGSRLEGHLSIQLLHPLDGGMIKIRLDGFVLRAVVSTACFALFTAHLVHSYFYCIYYAYNRSSRLTSISISISISISLSLSLTISISVR